MLSRPSSLIIAFVLEGMADTEPKVRKESRPGSLTRITGLRVSRDYKKDEKIASFKLLGEKFHHDRTLLMVNFDGSLFSFLLTVTYAIGKSDAKPPYAIEFPNYRGCLPVAATSEEDVGYLAYFANHTETKEESNARLVAR